MQKFLELRAALFRELDAGYFDEVSWRAAVIMACDLGCYAIQAQLERYIEHYRRINAD